MGKEDEKVLVVPTRIAVPRPWLGINPDGVENFEQMVREFGSFQRRGDVEEDPTLKQVIPYSVFSHRALFDSYFLMQRLANHSEARLANRYSLGIGGHINEHDIKGQTIRQWGAREFMEEVDYNGEIALDELGLLNDDRDQVGQVHLGYVLRLRGTSSDIKIKDEHKTGRLVSLRGLNAHYQQMEGWSQLVVAYLNNSELL